MLLSILSCLSLAGAPVHALDLAPAVQDPPAFRAEALEGLAIEGEREVLALALDLARRGRPEAGLARLRPLAEGSEALEPWLERLEEFAGARERLIEKVLGKTDLRWLENGVEVELEITGREGERLGVAPSEEHGVVGLDVAEIDAAVLAHNAKRRSTNFGPKWMQGFALWLAGDATYREALDRTGRKLRQELAEETQLLDLGRGLAALEAARAAAGAGGAELEAGLELLIEARAAFERCPELNDGQTAFAGVGAELLAALAPSRELDSMLDAEVELLEDGRVKLVYDFKGGRRPYDFVATEDWFEFGGGYPADGLPVSDAPEFVPDVGLRFTGSHTLAHRLPFTDDVAIDLSLLYEVLPDGEPLGVVLAGAGVRPGRAWAVAWNFMLLQAIDGDRELSLSADAPGLSAFAGKAYPYRFRLADGTLSMSTRGQERAKLEVGEFQPGEVLFGARCRHAIVFERVTITGRPFIEDFGLLQQTWVERQTARHFTF